MKPDTIGKSSEITVPKFFAAEHAWNAEDQINLKTLAPSAVINH